MKINYREIKENLEQFLADDELGTYLDRAEFFLNRKLKQDMSEEQALDFLETNYLFNDEMNKSEILTAADIMRAIRMGQYKRKKAGHSS